MPDQIVDGLPLTDATLLARTAAGERGAFDTFVQRHQASVFRFARTQVPRVDQAEDLLQQAFLAAWQAAGAFRGDDSARAWLLTITRHAATRVRDRERRYPLDETPVDELGVQAGWGASPEFLAMRHEAQARVRDALARLSADDREILTVRELEGASGEETANLLGLTLPAMKSRLHRARLRLVGELRKGHPDAVR